MPGSFAPLLDTMVGSDNPGAAIRAAFDLARLLQQPVCRPQHARLIWLLTRRPGYRHDYLTRALTFHLLGALGTGAVPELSRALAQQDGTEGYAAAALRGKVTPSAILPLTHLLRSPDAFTRAQAQQALFSMPAVSSTWLQVPALLPPLLEEQEHAGTRIAAIELLSRGPSNPGVVARLRGVAAREAGEVQAAAIRALGDVRAPDCAEMLSRIVVKGEGESALAAVESLGEIGGSHVTRLLRDLSRNAPGATMRDAADLALRRRHGEKRAPAPGLHVAQLTLPAVLDPDFNAAGQADSGGIASLLLALGRALGRQPDTSRVYTVSRTPADPNGPQGLEQPLGENGTLVGLTFGSGENMQATGLWPYGYRIERALDRYFGTQPPLDALHLRFAHAGTAAAANWARRRGVPVHFTLAPDPYVPMTRAFDAGTLTRNSFGNADRGERLLWRASLLEQMVHGADGLALLPREHWRATAAKYFGHELQSELEQNSERVRVIAEGIELPGESRRGRGSGETPALREMRSPGWGRGPAPRRLGLPVLVSVGRLHPVKGMARLARAWAGDEQLRAGFNLVIVGGNLDAPTATERDVLAEIERIIAAVPAAAGGLLLAGAVAHGNIGVLLETLRDGVPDVAAPDAIYVCASEKEEFGLAILEAMAAGLVVVAPREGGPATYLRDGEAGFLADTADADALAAAIRRAATLRARPEQYRAMTAKLRATVASRFSVDRMAAELLALYRQPIAVRERAS